MSDVNNPHLQKTILNVFRGLHSAVADQSHVTSLGVDRYKEHF